MQGARIWEKENKGEACPLPPSLTIIFLPYH